MSFLRSLFVRTLFPFVVPSFLTRGTTGSHITNLSVSKTLQGPEDTFSMAVNQQLKNLSSIQDGHHSLSTSGNTNICYNLVKFRYFMLKLGVVGAENHPRHILWSFNYHLYHTITVLLSSFFKAIF